MDDLSSALIAFEAAAGAAGIDYNVLLERLAMRLEGVHRVPQRRMSARKIDGVATLSAPFARAPIVTLGFEDAAKVLGLHDKLLRILLDFGSLQSVTFDGHEHIPEWQFYPSSENGLLPGLGMILTAAEGRLSWIELAFFMVTPQKELTADGELSIVEWLHYGYPAVNAVNLIRAQHDEV